MRTILLTIWVVSFLAPVNHGSAEVNESAADGFRLTIERDLSLTPGKAYDKFVTEFSSWYDARHSYSMKAENLTLDLEKHCMLEKLPDGGFVRHMEIVFHQPGKLIRLTGGLGPLQGMGVQGAMTVSFLPSPSGSKVTLGYVVTGARFSNLDKIAEPVHQVLSGQMDRFASHCER